MSVKLTKLFRLREGRRDQELRRLAQDSLKKTGAAVRSGAAEPRAVGDSLFFDLAKMHGDDLHRGLTLQLKFGPPARRVPRFIAAPKWSKIVLPVPSRTTDAEKHVENVRLFVPSFLEKNRSSYVHEFIHFLDRRRLKGKIKRISSTLRAGAEKYFNQPLELNAYIQQAFDSIEESIADLELTRDDARVVMGGSPQALAREIESQTKEFVDALTPENRKKFLKRVAQLWDDVLARFPEGKKK